MRDEFFDHGLLFHFIVFGGLRRLLLAVLMGAGVDFKNSGNFIVFFSCPVGETQ